MVSGVFCEIKLGGLRSYWVVVLFRKNGDLENLESGNLESGTRRGLTAKTLRREVF